MDTTKVSIFFNHNRITYMSTIDNKKTDPGISYTTVSLFVLKCIRTFKPGLPQDELRRFDDILRESFSKINITPLTQETVDYLTDKLDFDPNIFMSIIVNILSDIADIYDYNVRMYPIVGTGDCSDILLQTLCRFYNTRFKFSDKPVSDKSIITKIFTKYQSPDDPEVTGCTPVDKLVDKYCNWKIKHDELTGIELNTVDPEYCMSTLGLLVIDDLISNFLNPSQEMLSKYSSIVIF